MADPFCGALAEAELKHRRVALLKLKNYLKINRSFGKKDITDGVYTLKLAAYSNDPELSETITETAVLLIKLCIFQKRSLPVADVIWLTGA